MKKIKRGFAAMSPERQREIASLGGRSQGAQNNPGNFAHRKDASEAGRKGGLKRAKNLKKKKNGIR